MKLSRHAIEVANPRPGSPTHISRKKAYQHCRVGVAFWTRDGRLRFREHNPRQGSDVYVSGAFDLRIVNTRRTECGPVFPHLQWLHYGNGICDAAAAKVAGASYAVRPETSMHLSRLRNAC